MTKRIRMVHFIKGNGSPIVSFKKNRNALCSCGSGKKQKRCCGVETKFYHSKPNEIESHESKKSIRTYELHYANLGPKIIEYKKAIELLNQSK